MIAYQEVSEHADTFLPTLFKVQILSQTSSQKKKEEKKLHTFCIK